MLKVQLVGEGKQRKDLSVRVAYLRGREVLVFLREEEEVITINATGVHTLTEIAVNFTVGFFPCWKKD